MNYFSKYYKAISQLEGLPFKVDIHQEDSSRWICCCIKENIGKNGFRFTLIDNYLESYYLTWLGPGTTELSNYSPNINVSITFNPSVNDYMPFSIHCKSLQHELLPLPDFAIDVLQTVHTNTLHEVIRRITVAFHEKHQNKLQ
jgi:hypothetical protein